MMHLEAIIERNKTEATVTISKKEHDELKKAAKELAALEAAGVDNWEGYSEAFAGGEA